MVKRLTLMALVILGCTSAETKENRADTSQVVSLEAKDFKQSLDANPAAVILDVRTPPEVAEGVIPGAINIDYNAPDFGEKIAALDKSKQYYVYCQAGVRSSKALNQMKAEGFTSVINLEGGYKSWVKNGYETEKP